MLHLSSTNWTGTVLADVLLSLNLELAVFTMFVVVDMMWRMMRRIFWVHLHLLSSKILLHCMLLICQHLKVLWFQ